jgi:ABC-type sugar transport system permease subunit
MNQPAEAIGPQRSKRAIQNRKGVPWLPMLPTLVVLAFLGLFPCMYAIRIAAFNISISQPYLPVLFVGLSQYKGLVRDANFINALRVTLIFTLEAVFVQFWLGLGIAMLFRRRIVAKSFFRVCILAPMVLTPVVVGLICRFLLSLRGGGDLLRRASTSPGTGLFFVAFETGKYFEDFYTKAKDPQALGIPRRIAHVYADGIGDATRVITLRSNVTRRIENKPYYL